ncbi:MAG: PD40 domain-containing protein, partial [Anaerolineae bacterium]|nr:PD40 domain-containing protein [Anaerolineae bacterium]
ARRWLAIDPLHEPAHRHLMVLYAKANRRAAALRQYEILCRTLQEELGAPPSARTQEVYEGLLRGEIPLAPTTTEAILERELRQVGPCPYRGLSAFREEDAPFFFGREAFVERLTEAVTTQPFVALVVGASGSGKSSVVHAGLLPRLRSQGCWCICALRPGREPFYALAGALLPHLAPELGEIRQLAETRQLADLLREGTVPLADAVRRIRARQTLPARLLLLVDQFEELFTLCPDPEIRRRFIDTLLDIVAASEATGRAPGPLTLLVTLRADFMGQALGHRRLADVLSAASEMLGPMTREELREAIEKPAASQGAAFEAGLVDRLLDDVGEEPGNLPLLEFALTLLWERLDFGWITHAAYEQIGRVAGALAQYAQEVFNALPDQDQLLCHRIFTQLVQPGEGTEDTRRVATRADVGENAWPLVQHLADRRLVVTNANTLTGEQTVEVVHEALIRSWDQLQAWMAKDRAFRMWQERLRVALRTWETTDHDEGALLRGVPLAEAEEWLAARAEELTTSERSFIQAGITLRERRAAEREAQRQRELHQAAIGLAAEARNQMRGPNQDVAPLLALEAVEHYPYTWQAELALAEVALNSHLVWQAAHSARLMWPPSVSPDFTRVLAASMDGLFYVRDLKSGERLLEVRAYEGGEAVSHRACWAPGGDQIATGTGSSQAPVRVWNAQTGERLAELATCGSCGYGAEWSPDGKRIAIGSRRRECRAGVWDASTGEMLYPLEREERQPRLVWFSPDGAWISTSQGEIWDSATGEFVHTLEGYEARDAGDHPWGGHRRFSWSPVGARVGVVVGGTVTVWDAETGSEALRLSIGNQSAGNLWWSHDGRHLLTTCGNRDKSPAIVWDAETGAELRELPHYEVVHDWTQPWSPTDDRLVIPDSQGHITVWNTGSWRKLLDLAAHSGWARATWLPDGRGLITGGDDGQVKMWRLDSTQLTVGGDRVGSAWLTAGFRTPIWSPDGTEIGRAYGDGVRVWSVSTGVEQLRLQKADETPTEWGVWQTTWSPDGKLILTGTFSGDLDLWSAKTGEHLRSLQGHKRAVTGAGWAPDGRRALTCGGDAVVWDTANGEALATFAEQNYYAGSWSPDGVHIVLVDHFSGGGPVRVWDSRTGKAVLTLLPEEFDAGTGAAAWSPDGNRIVTVSDDSSGRIWDAQTGRLIARFGCEATVNLVVWSPSGRRFLTGGYTGIYVWDASTLSRVAFYPRGSEQVHASWSPDGRSIAVGYRSGDLRIYPAWQSLKELMIYARARCIRRDFTPEERVRFELPDSVQPEHDP